MMDWDSLDNILEPNLFIPDKPNKSGVILDFDSIVRAIERLGVKFPVYLKWSSGVYRHGCHRWNEDIETHTITLSHYRNGIQTSETLWHELVHAAQSERCENPADFYAYHYKPEGLTGQVYRRNKYEVEAKAIAKAAVERNFMLHS